MAIPGDQTNAWRIPVMFALIRNDVSIDDFGFIVRHNGCVNIGEFLKLLR